MSDDKFVAMLRERERACSARADFNKLEGNPRVAGLYAAVAADWAALRKAFVAMRKALKKADAECEIDPGNLFLNLDTWTEIKQALRKAGA